MPASPNRLLTNQGEVPQTLRLDGVTEHVTITNSQDLTLEFTNGFSLTGVFNATLGDKYFYVISKMASVTEFPTAASRSFEIYYNFATEELAFALYDNALMYHTYFIPGAVVLNQDTFFAVSYNPVSGIASSCVNGVYDEFQLPIFTLNYHSYPVIIGATNGTDTRPVLRNLPGTVSNFSIWKRVLTEAEMQAVASSTNKLLGELLPTGSTGYTSEDCLFYSTFRYTSTSAPTNRVANSYGIALTQATAPVFAVKTQIMLIGGRLRRTDNAAPVAGSGGGSGGNGTLPTEGMRVWFKTDSTEDYIVDNNEQVSLWLDKSTFGNHASPTGSTTAHITNDIAGTKSGVFFDTTGTGFRTLGGIGIEPTDSSTFLVVFTANSVDLKAIFAYGTPSGRDLYELIFYYGSLLVSNYFADYYTNIPSLPGTFVVAFRKDRDNDVFESFQNGVLSGTTSSIAGDTTVNTPLILGAGAFGSFNYQGFSISELVAYNRALSDAELAAASNHLVTKYSDPQAG